MQSIVSDLLELFADFVGVETFSSATEYGVESYGALTNRRAHVFGRVRMVMDEDGKEVVSTVQATLGGAFGVTVKDRFTLPIRFSTDPNTPGNLTARQPKAIAVGKSSDENGAHHEVVYF